MKILVESYNSVFQNAAGGVQIRIENFIENYTKISNDIKLFDKWTDKIVDFDILHIFKANIEDYQLVKLAKNNNIPVVISTVIPSEKHLNIMLNRLICKITPIHTGYWYLDQMLLEADTIIAQTNKEARFINKYYKIPLEKIAVIPNGANIKMNENFIDEFNNKTGISGKYVLQVGRFDRNKNQLNVIKALSDTDIQVVFIGGEDSGQPEYYEECKKLAGRNFHFLGWIKHDDPLLSSAYQNAHVVVLPSYKEIFGNSLIEGGASGANLVATKELPLEDWGIKDICRSIDPNNIRDIREKIVAAYHQPLNPKTSEVIVNKFSWERVIEEHFELYKNLHANKGRSSI